MLFNRKEGVLFQIFSGLDACLRLASQFDVTGDQPLPSIASLESFPCTFQKLSAARDRLFVAPRQVIDTAVNV